MVSIRVSVIDAYPPRADHAPYLASVLRGQSAHRDGQTLSDLPVRLLIITDETGHDRTINRSFGRFAGVFQFQKGVLQ
jgi:hypothetical protein